MADVFSKEKRSWLMSRIRARNTKPELVVRSLLHRMGYRFTINARNNRYLPGKPDIVLPKWKTVVFVNGCFWHAHKPCPIFHLPKTRTEWWRAKLDKNHERDLRNESLLKEAGWNVVTIWECELANSKKIEFLSKCLPFAIERRPKEYRFDNS